MPRISSALFLGVVVIISTLPDTIQTGDTGCRGQLDVVAVVDGSGSISKSEFQQTLLALINLTHTLDVQIPDRRLGVIVFSSRVNNIINVTGDLTSLIKTIGKIVRPGGGTSTFLGIDRMTKMFHDFERPDVPRVGIVITDGQSSSTQKTIEAASLAKSAGINMFSVGVGTGVGVKELEGIASSADQALHIEDFTKLATSIVKLITSVCPETAPPPTSGPCDNCKMVNGIGYNKHAECEKFFQCQETDNGIYDFQIRTCSYGTFWNQEILQCDFIINVDCPTDPCTTNHIHSYKTTGNCSQYYTCVNGKSQAASCPTGSSYKFGSCVTDSTCVPSSEGPSETCSYSPVPGDVCRYNWVVNGIIHTFDCPSGTAFDSTSCSCLYNPNIQCGGSCQALVDIDFNTLEIGEYDNYGAVISNGHAYFNGSSNIKILSLANVDFNSKLNIKLRFKGDNPTTIHQSLLNNADCESFATVAITTTGLSTTFTVVNTDGIQQNVILKTTSNEAKEWQVAEYNFNSDSLTGTINGYSSSATIAGPIQTSECAFQLGLGGGLSGFRGLIDYVVVSRC